MWNDKIMPSRYASLPPLTAPGMFALLRLLTGHFSAGAFTEPGDELAPGRRKLIHAFGAEARLRLVITPTAAHDYTGILAGGAECIIGRFSLASKPTPEASIPALALKIFIAGEPPSLNLLLMHAVDAQPGKNYFAQTFSNVLPPAESFSARLLAAAFAHSAVQIGAVDGNPGRLTLDHLTSMQTDGKPVVAPRTPYRLLFQPTAQAHALMRDDAAGSDFRDRLATLPVGQAIYDVFALAEGAAPAAATPLGQLLLISPVIASRYGDETLYFRHYTATH
jgi:hypothetical protein